MELFEVRDKAVEIAREAGELLRQGVNQGKEIARKSSQVDLVTQYDQQSEALIVSRLGLAFPDHGVVAEEGTGGGHRQELTWYIDPLDGTNNFAHGFPHFAVSMALYAGDGPLVAVTYDPMKDECFTAVRGGGALLTSGGQPGHPLGVSPRDRLLDCLLATGFPYDRHTSGQDNIAQLSAFLKRARGIRRAGAATLDLAYVAAGRFDGFWEFKLAPWDVAAGKLLVLEAGGSVTDVNGADLAIQAKVSLVASNRAIHPEMLKVLRSVR